jgi:sulfur transfer protein SufE
MLRQQEAYIMGRLEELDKKEKRYQHLLQLETELRLLEQRLKQNPDYDRMRDDIRKE